MLEAVPAPGPVPFGERRQAVRHHAGHHRGLFVPSPEQRVQPHPLQVCTLDRDSLAIHEVVAAHRTVVGRRGIHRGHDVGHVNRPGDLVEQAPHEPVIGARGVLGLHLVRLPAVRRRHGHAAGDWHRLEQFQLRGRAALGRHGRLEDRREVSSRLGGRHGRQRVPPQKGEQFKGRCKLRHAPMLAGANLVEPVQAFVGTDPLTIEEPAREQAARVPLRDPVLGRVAVLVEPHAVHVVLRRDAERTDAMIGLDQLEVELHALQPLVVDVHAE